MRSNRAPPWAEVIRLAIDARLLDLHVAMPAKVDAYNAAKGTVDVVPLLQDQVVDAGGNTAPMALPKIPNVPLVFPGGGGFRATFPIAQGDTVLIIIADRSLDIWKATGQLADPKLGSHSIPDAIAIPGLRSPSSPWTSTPTDRATFGQDGGPVLEATSSALNLGAGAAHPVPLGDNLAQAIAYWIDQAQIASVGPLVPLKVPLSGLVTALGFTPGSVSNPGLGVPVLSSLVNTK